jgi:cytochrome P450
MSTAEHSREARPDAEPIPEINPHDPATFAAAYDLNDDWRTEGRAKLVRIFNDRPATAPDQPARRVEMETLYVNHYDDVATTLLDNRLSVDLRNLVIPEPQPASGPGTESAGQAAPEGEGLLAHSLLTLDLPDHTRIRKLVQPTFTPGTMELLRRKIQVSADDLLDQVERVVLEAIAPPPATAGEWGRPPSPIWHGGGPWPALATTGSPGTPPPEAMPLAA